MAAVGNVRAVISSFAMAVPPRCVTNHDLSQWMDTSDEWITQRTGIKTRYWVEPPTTASDLGTQAARGTLAQAGGGVVDALVAATISPDHNFPGIGVQIQSKLALPPVPAYDLRNQCCGFLYGLEMARALVQAGQYRRILLVGAEVHSTALDISTRGRDLAVLFGDGAGSCLVEQADQPAAAGAIRFEILGTELHADGQGLEDLWCQYPGSAHFPTWITSDLVADAKIFPKMNGRKVFENAVRKMSEVSLSLLNSQGLAVEQVALFVPHQANLRINQMVASQIGLSDSQVFNTVQDYGNTTAATIPIGMTKALEAGRIQIGELVLSAAFGSGFTWGAALLRRIA